MSLRSHPLIQSLRGLRGNPKACVLTEPLKVIPFNLYIPYVSVYMLALGLSDSQIGLLLTVHMVVRIIASILGGPITDKLGRRKTTFVMDVIVWGIPTLIWAVAQDFTYFLAAAIVHGTMGVVQTSWTCLFVEDAEEDQLIDMYSWINIAGLLSGFFAPVAGILIQRFGL